MCIIGWSIDSHMYRSQLSTTFEQHQAITTKTNDPNFKQKWINRAKKLINGLQSEREMKCYLRIWRWSKTWLTNQVDEENWIKREIDDDDDEESEILVFIGGSDGSFPKIFWPLLQGKSFTAVGLFLWAVFTIFLNYCFNFSVTSTTFFYLKVWLRPHYGPLGQ